MQIKNRWFRAALAAAVVAGAAANVSAHGQKVNYDKSKIPAYTLEDPLTFVDGTKVEIPRDWDKRRAEILEIFQREMYGRMPPAPEAVVTECGKEVVSFAGYALRRQIKMWFKKDKSGPMIEWTLWRPRYAKTPVPVVLFLNYHGAYSYTSDKGIPPPRGWTRDKPEYKITGHKFTEAARNIHSNPEDKSYLPVQEILARGYAILTACYCDISPDPTFNGNLQETLAYTGIFELWGKRDKSRKDNTTALGAWAWTLSRGMDYIERDAKLDEKRVVLTGCSRLAKAAFIAGAFDTRFPFTVPVQTGGGGVPLQKHYYGENAATMNASFRHWYCENYRKYANNEKALKFDQHLLAAAIAPRALLVCSFDNKWYDAEGEWLALKAASPVWEAFGLPGLPGKGFPEYFSTSEIGERLGLVCRKEAHGIAAIDFKWMLDMADNLWAKDLK